jgi:NADPH:quinone reductase-like Zn-dependent oxidoreductase
VSTSLIPTIGSANRFTYLIPHTCLLGRRSGLYPSTTFPVQIGKEAAGIIAALPTDVNVLNDEDYKKRNYQLGDKVVLVCSDRLSKLGNYLTFYVLNRIHPGDTQNMSL